jgi:hypothetical protein
VNTRSLRSWHVLALGDLHERERIPVDEREPVELAALRAEHDRLEVLDLACCFSPSSILIHSW